LLTVETAPFFRVYPVLYYQLSNLQNEGWERDKEQKLQKWDV